MHLPDAFIQSDLQSIQAIHVLDWLSNILYIDLGWMFYFTLL